MHRLLLFLAAVAFATSGFADLGSGGPPPDAKVRDEVSFARRGSLGTDSYVVTNVLVGLPGYALAVGGATNLVDRAVNCLTATGDVTLVAPPVPLKRETDAFRAARAFMLSIAIPTNAPAPEITFAGFGKLLFAECGEELKLDKGRTLVSFIEIGDGEFLVDAHKLATP